MFKRILSLQLFALIIGFSQSIALAGNKGKGSTDMGDFKLQLDVKNLSVAAGENGVKVRYGTLSINYDAPLLPKDTSVKERNLLPTATIGTGTYCLAKAYEMHNSSKIVRTYGLARAYGLNRSSSIIQRLGGASKAKYLGLGAAALSSTINYYLSSRSCLRASPPAQVTAQNAKTRTWPEWWNGSKSQAESNGQKSEK